MSAIRIIEKIIENENIKIEDKIEIIIGSFGEFSDNEKYEIVANLINRNGINKQNMHKIFNNNTLCKYVNNTTLNTIDAQFNLKNDIKKINDTIDQHLIDCEKNSINSNYPDMKYLVINNADYFGFNLQKYFIWYGLFSGDAPFMGYTSTWKVYCEIHVKEKATKDLYGLN